MVNSIIQIVWFLFIGWWLALLWLGLALVMCLTIVGIPMGTVMALKTPKVMFLSE